MVKNIIFVFLLLSILKSEDVYQKNCVSCHNDLPVSIDKFFFRYLLKYSSERNVKEKMFDYLKNPSKEKTVMVESFIDRFGVKQPSNLNDEELKKALDIYWDKYKVIGRLK